MFLGIEIGGTKLQLGVGTGRDAELAALVRHDVDATRGAAAILEEIERSATALIQKHPVEGLALASAARAIASQVSPPKVIRSAAGRAFRSPAGAANHWAGPR